MFGYMGFFMEYTAYNNTLHLCFVLYLIRTKKFLYGALLLIPLLKLLHRILSHFPQSDFGNFSFKIQARIHTRSVPEELSLPHVGNICNCGSVPRQVIK